jgi:hypothetical protein
MAWSHIFIFVFGMLVGAAIVGWANKGEKDGNDAPAKDL